MEFCLSQPEFKDNWMTDMYSSKCGRFCQNVVIQDVKINNITTKSPLSEIVFEKNSQILSRLSSLYEKVKTGNDDFLTMTLSTSEVSVICSDRIKNEVLKHFKQAPHAGLVPGTRD